MKTLIKNCSRWLSITCIIVLIAAVFKFTIAQNVYKPLKGTTPAGRIVNLSSLPQASTIRGPVHIQPRHIPHPYSEAVKKYQQEQAASSTLKASEEMDNSVSSLSKPKINSVQSTQSLNLVQKFQGQTGTVAPPPDPVIAVGTNYIVEAVNTTFAVYDKTGLLKYNKDFSTLFEVSVTLDELTDPKVIYDQYSQRYVMLILRVSANKQIGAYLIAVSETSDPTGNWYCYSSNATLDGSTPTTNGPDYPGLGYDDQAIYVTSNQISNYAYGNTFEYAKIRIFNKSQLYSHSTVTYSDFIKYVRSLWADFYY